MATPAENRAAQRQLARDLKAGKRILPSAVTTRAREAAAIGSASKADIRADLEERAYRKAVAGLGDKPRFNALAVETRIKGGIAVTYKNGGTDYYPQAVESNGVVTDIDGNTTKVPKNAKASSLPGMTNDQLRKAINTSGDDWAKLAHRGKLKGGKGNRFLYH